MEYKDVALYSKTGLILAYYFVVLLPPSGVYML